jgi:hypothetical protein
MLKHKSIPICSVIFVKIIDKDVLFLRISFEVFLQSLISEQLFLKFISLLLFHPLVIQCLYYVFNSWLYLNQFLPHYGNTLEHVLSLESFHEFSLIEFQFLSVLFWLNECQLTTIIIFHQLSCLFVLVILFRSIKVNNILHIFELWLMRVSALHDYHDVELTNMEEMSERFLLVFWQIRRKHECFKLKST